MSWSKKTVTLNVNHNKTNYYFTKQNNCFSVREVTKKGKTRNATIIANPKKYEKN